MKQFKNILFVSQGLAGKSDSLEQLPIEQQRVINRL